MQTFARIAIGLSPDVLVMENVPEVLARRHWSRFLRFRQLLQSAGYQVRAQIHDLAPFGVPQHRFRAVVIAARAPFSMPIGYLAPTDFVTVRQAIEHLPPTGPGERSDADPMHYCTNHRPSTVRTLRQVPRDGGTRRPGIGPECLDRVDGFRDVYGRMYWDRPANTITAYSRNPASGRYAHPEQDRGLTIREAALLQGFPSSYVFEGSFDSKFAQIGNAVAPTFAAYLAAHVLGILLTAGQYPIDEGLRHDVTSPMSNSFSSGIAGRKLSLR